MSTVPYDKGDSSGSIFAIDDASSNKIPAGACYLVQAGVAVPWTGAVTLASTTITGSVATTVADGSDAALGAKADAEASSDTGTFSLIGLFKRALGKLTAIVSWLPTLVSGRVPVDGSGVTQPVSIAAAIPVTDNGGSLTVDGTFWQATQPVSLASVPSHHVTNAGTFAVQVSAAIPAGTNNIGDVDVLTLPAVTIAAAQTLATVTTVGTVTSLTQMNGQVIAMGTGARSAGTQRVTIATDDVVPASQSGTWTVQPGNTANTTPWLMTAQAGTGGGCSVYSFLSTAAVQAAAIKASAGQVYGLHFFNNTATVCYVRLYNQTASPSTSDTPVYRAIIPANTSGAGFVVNIPPGVAFGTGIGIRVSAASADNDATALAANAILGNVLYK